MSLPTADDLFRPTVVPDPDPAQHAEARDGGTSGEGTPEIRDPAPRTPSGRVRHDEKVTVYVTAEELLGLEHTRLTLRGRHALSVDRGRLVREAVSIALADFDANGADSVLVQRLAGD